ncbi:hypothetical protein LOD44_08840 [Xylella fastidiosa subsp. multiplex]|uniref:Uncharacterized protein n=2 Tax=Xylella fastidiosa TaxID=2371 RepID=A0A9Q4QRX2_XYLFS|nr:hypothetical protein [Xylella fastidiosa]ACA12767.1 conserved hypothetical protein [Xylella fastidiosa M12]KFA41268.1 hypothetical protein DF22_001847 [Xylella fastidiosa]MBS9444638.1 hypothetical protein [Xylella fastidiosa subsp. multiplex]MBS9446934.1 hypothetical protein [Xylella fastidiosa subsp. multiplex]MBS9450657.1 hypothetical protein [Xylella fastidiosa subsp. multiplex]
MWLYTKCVNKDETVGSKNTMRLANSAPAYGTSSGEMIFSLMGGAIPGRAFVFAMEMISSSRCIGHLRHVACGGIGEDVTAAQSPYFGDGSVLPVLQALRAAHTWIYPKLPGNFSGSAKAIDQVSIGMYGRLHKKVNIMMAFNVIHNFHGRM